LRTKDHISTCQYSVPINFVPMHRPEHKQSCDHAPAHALHAPCARTSLRSSCFACVPASASSRLITLQIMMIFSSAIFAVTAKTCELASTSATPSGCCAHGNSPLSPLKPISQGPSSSPPPSPSSSPSLTPLPPLPSPFSRPVQPSVATGMCDISDRHQVRKQPATRPRTLL
jgi:hypothetical protein